VRPAPDHPLARLRRMTPDTRGGNPDSECLITDERGPMILDGRGYHRGDSDPNPVPWPLRSIYWHPSSAIRARFVLSHPRSVLSHRSSVIPPQPGPACPIATERISMNGSPRGGPPPPQTPTAPIPGENA